MLQKTTSRIAFVAALLSLGCALAEPAFARGGRGGGGGGMRAGGGGGMRGGGGGYSASRGGGGGLRSSGATSINRGSSGYNRPSGGMNRQASYQRPGGGQNRSQMAANRPAGGYDRGQVAANRPAGGRGDINRGDINRGEINRGQINRGDNRVNTGNINAGNNINIDNDGGWGGWNDYPVGAGLAMGTAAAVTAAAWGSVFYSLPTGCSPYPYAGYSYYHCGGAYYEPRYEGDTVVYVTVPEPGSSGSSTTVVTP